MRIQVENISKSIKGKPILRDVSLTIASGQSLALIGPNGSGKSTLLRVMAGLLSADRGRVTVDGDRVDKLSPRTLAQRLGFVTQEAGTTDAIPVIEAVKLGRTPWLSFAAPFRTNDQQIVDQAMRAMAISEYKNTLFNALSGGERQRVHIARVLAQTPQVFLLDEPTNHLDIRHQIAIIDWVKQQNATVVLALHDLNHAFACDRVAVMNGGALAAFGPPKDVLVPSVIEPVFKVGVQQNHSNYSDHPVLTFVKYKAA
ncbi:ABC transporter ATP-binding protein [Shimia sp. CNT1-13L.2]|uniref:ABC transporter ATP-binding protein n=1 Tax=Shimia sp. CNT1-13L.2 TaxID=2959663 RepID=UPI0020CF3AE7|nr:ABC transporter ATP-binding protein [Shimia sp. CNT1-13L.2]